MVEDEQVSEQRFENWLRRLEQALKVEDGSESQYAQVLEAIRSAALFDKQSLPSFLQQNERVLSCLSTTSEDLKSRLRRLSAPKVLNNFDAVRKVSLASAQLSDISPDPLKNSNPEEEKTLESFFESLDNSPSDVVVGICKLLDYGSRAVQIKSSDASFLGKLVQYEQRRQRSSEASIAQRSEIVPFLEGKDEENLLAGSLDVFRGELTGLKSSLQAALDEEEEARRAYLAAVEKARQARESVTKLESFTDMLATQAKMLVHVNSIRATLDEFNRNSATNRLAFLNTLQDAFNQVQFRTLDQRLRVDFPVLLQNLHELFRTMIAGADYGTTNAELTTELSEQPVSYYCAVRIGLETLRLWKRMQTESLRSIVEAQLAEFEHFLESIISRLPDLPLKSIGGGSQLRESTVVLYFDHLCHDTPEHHVETQRRADACLKLLMKKVTVHTKQHNLLLGIVPLNNSSTNGFSASSSRELVLEKCNDILSPPLWCLPLVHGPQYLTNLWRSSQEAQRDDLLVPLEFETEWETEDESLDEDWDELVLEKMTRRAETNELLSKDALHESWRKSLGEERAAKLEKVIFPRAGDAIIARAIRRGIPRPRIQLSSRTRSAADESVDAENAIAREDSGRSRGLSRGVRVRTPYGPAVLLDRLDAESEKAAREEQRILRVKYEWGAKGYINARDVERLRSRVRNSAGETPVPRVRSTAADSSDPMNSDRFKHTNFTIHRIVRRILGRIHVQRLLLDRIDVKDAHLSLYMHGRTSHGTNKAVEDAIMRWLGRFERHTLEEFLDEKEKQIGVQEEPEQFFAQMEMIRTSDVANSMNIATFAMDPNESREKLREEGFQYASSRLVKKSGEMRARPIRSRKSLSVKDERGPSAAAAGATRTPSRAGRSARKTPRTKEVRVMTDEDEARLRLLFQRINAAMGVSQANFAKELTRRFNFQVTQTGVSGWVHGRASNALSRSLDRYVFQWIDHHKTFLKPSELEHWDILFSRYPQLLEVVAAGTTLEIKVEPLSSSSDVQPDSMDMEDTQAASMLSNLAHTEIGTVATGAAQAEVDTTDAKQEDLETEDVTQAEADTTDAADVTQAEIEVESTVGDDVSLMSCEDESTPPSACSEPEPKMKTLPVVKREEEEEYKEDADNLSSSEELVSESDAEAEPDAEEEAQGVGEEPGDEEYLDLNSTADQMDANERIILQTELLKLHKEFVSEQARRNLTHSYISQEASRIQLILPQPNVSKFVREKAFPFVGRSREFLNFIKRWLAYSRTKNSPFVPGMDGNSCSGCGVRRMNFPSHKDFLVHVGTCAAANDVVPITAKINAYNYAGPLRVLDLQTEQSVIASKIAELEKTPSISKRNIPQFCFFCHSEGEKLSTCSICARHFHTKCIPDSTETSCSSCLSMLLKGFVQLNERDAEPTMRVNFFDDERAQWEQAFVVHCTSRLDKSFVLLKLIRTNDNDSSDMQQYIWREWNSNVLLVATNETMAELRRKRGRRPNSYATPSARRRVSGGMGDASARSVRKSRERTSRYTGEEGTGRRRGARARLSFATADDATTGEGSAKKRGPEIAEEAMTDTYISANSLKAALCAAGSACRAVDIAMTTANTNVFVCTRPPGHHAGRYGCTHGCLGTGFCLLNNAAIALTYARVRWGLERIAIVDIDVHFGNGTADILRGDDSVFFASVHMIYGTKNDGANIGTRDPAKKDILCGFYPSHLGVTEISDRYVAVGVQPAHFQPAIKRRRRGGRSRTSAHEEEVDEELAEPQSSLPTSSSQNSVDNAATDSSASANVAESDYEFVGASGFVKALKEVVLPRLEAYKPQLLIISAGFDGCGSDPLGGQMGLTPEDYSFCTNLLTSSMSRMARESRDPRSGRVISLLEGGYDTSEQTQGLARCVDAHVSALRVKN